LCFLLCQCLSHALAHMPQFAYSYVLVLLWTYSHIENVCLILHVQPAVNAERLKHLLGHTLALLHKLALLHIWPGVPATAIATGQFYTCAVVTGNGLMCWGRNDEGQLGIGSTSNALSPAVVAGARRPSLQHTGSCLVAHSEAAGSVFGACVWHDAGVHVCVSVLLCLCFHVDHCALVMCACVFGCYVCVRVCMLVR
jgi:hypothetical protein